MERKPFEIIWISSYGPDDDFDCTVTSTLKLKRAPVFKQACILNILVYPFSPKYKRSQGSYFNKYPTDLSW